ncbi:MAG: tetratricopeptide repeat protein [Planctomycetia bacterium]
MIVVLGCAVYLPAIHGGWLHDDATFVGGDLASRSGSLGQMFRLWLDPDGVDYFPLTYTAFWIQYAFFGLNTTGYHVTTLLLHLTSGLLLWKLFATLKIPGAWFAALAFTIHPACVESVAWISELKNTLSLVPFLISCIFWVMQDNATNGLRQKWIYTGSLFFFLLSMLAKPAAVAMPVVTLLYAWWKRGRIDGRDVVHAVPLFLISVVLGMVTVQFQHGRAIGLEELPLGGIDSRIALSGMAILFYLATIVWPVNLLPIYPAWQIDPPRLWQFLPWVVIVGAAWWMWSKRHTWGRHAILAFGFFLLMIAPVLGFVGLAYMRLTWVADHFLYLPMIGPLALLVAATAAWIESGDATRRMAGAVMAAVVTVFLAGNTFSYAGHWASEDRLWEYTVARNNDAWVAHDRLGTLDLGRNDVERALEHFRQASRLRPDLGETKRKLGQALLKQGNHDEAIPVLEEAVKASPWLPETRAILAEAYCKVGRIEQALKLAEKLLEDNPLNHGVRTTYAITVFETGDKPKAIEELERVLAIEPEHEPALNALERFRNSP